MSDQSGWVGGAPARAGRALGRAILVAALLLPVAAFLVTCERDDPLAPPDSLITLSASPQTVVVPKGGCPVTQISCTAATDPTGVCVTRVTATVRSKSGSRLEGQEVTFSTSAGDVFPAAETPLLTDGSGQARSLLCTSQAATVTVRSGSLEQTTQVQTASAPVGQVLLTVENQDGSGAEISQCTDTLDLFATVFDPNGAPIDSVLVVFEQLSSNTITGNFSGGGQELTDFTGEAYVTWDPGSACANKCMSDPNSSGICTLRFRAKVGPVASIDVEVQDNIP